MDAERARLGVIGGIVGGMAMGMWIMLYYFASDRGFWSPLGYIGHFFVRDADITSTGQVVVGAVVHMMMSMMLGAAVALIFARAARLTSMMRGVVVGLVVWIVQQYVVLNAFDEVAFDGFVQWAFAVGHALFGAMVGLVAGQSKEAAMRAPTAA
jgi:hypothetical protein